VPHKTLAGVHAVDLDDVLSNRRIGSALQHGAAVPNWVQAHVACVLQVFAMIVVMINIIDKLQDCSMRSAVVLSHALQVQNLCARLQSAALFLGGVEMASGGAGLDPNFNGSVAPPPPVNLQVQDVTAAAFAVAANPNCSLAHAMKQSAALQCVKVMPTAALQATTLRVVVIHAQDAMWIKPFASFAPRMRVMRYASERRLQMPNLAAHYKKELRVLLQV
jgi:hypothetical protein